MGMISFIKRSFLWWAALMVFHTAHTEGCNDDVVIVDVSSSLVNHTDFFSYCNMSDMNKQNWTLPQTRNLWFVNATKQGNCSTKACNNTISNVTKLENGYKVILNNVDGINLQFLLYANSLLPSGYSADTTHLIEALFELGDRTFPAVTKPLMGCLNYKNVSVKDLCANTSATYLNTCPFSGNGCILNVQQNGYMNCSRCLPPKKTRMNISIPTDGKPDTSAAVAVMKNLSSLVQLMGNESSASITMGSATGLLQKQDVENDVSLGYNKTMAWEQVDSSQKSDLMWSVKVPGEAIKMSHSKDNGTAFVGVLRFPELSAFQNAGRGWTFASDIFGILMGVDIRNLTDTIDICFRNISKNGADVTCMSSDGTGNWTTSGCSTKEANDTVTCSCTHLTFFAILMAEPGKNISEGDKTTLTYITTIGCGLSTFFLLVGLFIHFVMWHSQSRLGTTILMNLFVALVLLNITFLSNQQVWSQHNIGCIIIAAAMHFSMLATFTWFFIQGLHFYLILRTVNMKIRKYKLSFIGSGWETAIDVVSTPDLVSSFAPHYLMNGIAQIVESIPTASFSGFPAVVVIVIASTGNYQSVDDVEMCWITSKYIHYIVNVGYYLVIFTFTSFIFIMIIRKIIQAKQSVVKTSSKKAGAIFGLYVLLGLTWGVAFFSYGALTVPSYYIFTILNSFQGFFLFLYYYYFRNDEPEINQAASSTAPSLKKPANFSSTETSGPDTVVEYN